MVTILEINNLSYPIKVERGAKYYKVTYGQHVVRSLDYEEAAHELGECVFHALTCLGLTIED